MDWTAAAAGASGGFTLGLCVLIINLVDTLRSSSPSPRTGQTAWTHLTIAVLLAFIGGLSAHFLTGRAGDFLQGVAALSFILLVGGSAMSVRQSHDA